MSDKPSLYFGAKILAIVSSFLVLNLVNVDITYAVISTLSFTCVFLLEVLFSRSRRLSKAVIVPTSASVVACFLLGMDIYFPLFLILLIHILDLIIDSQMFYQVLVVALALSFLIFPPSMSLGALSLALVTLVLFCRNILMKLTYYTEQNNHQKDTIDELSKKLIDLKSLNNTLKYKVSVEERSRIAARIHDQIGHGISGSIIMLEAAMLMLKDQPDKAAQSIERATLNLREGVDEIRKALKEERAGRDLIGKNEIVAELEEYKISYNKNTSLVTNGDLNLIPFEIWACILDNLKECLTNLLKHSNATDFTLSIDVYKKVIKVEYKDNGKSPGDFTKGLGLEAIEERTVRAKGRCMFNKGENGFRVTNIFNY